MASRRMFNKELILSDRLQGLHDSAFKLYITANISADDDGFVSNVQSIIRTCKSNKKHLEQLQDNKLIHIFENGKIWLIDWHMNNHIRPERHQPTTNFEEYEFIKENYHEQIKKKAKRVGRSFKNDEERFEYIQNQIKIDKNQLTELDIDFYYDYLDKNRKYI